MKLLFYLVSFVIIISQPSCSVYYNSKEQSAYIPNVVNQDITTEKRDFSNSLFIGLNHIENQINYRATRNFALQNNVYLSKGFNLFDLGCSYSKPIKNILYLDFMPGISFGDMNYSRERKYLDGGIDPGYSDNIGYVKTEDINYHYYRLYFNPSLKLIFHNKIKFSLGSRISYSKFNGFEYFFKEIKKYYGRNEEIFDYTTLSNDIERIGFEPNISLHIPYKKVGVFFQVLYYGQIGNNLNINTKNLMTKADIPILLSCGFTLNFNFNRKNKP